MDFTGGGLFGGASSVLSKPLKKLGKAAEANTAINQLFKDSADIDQVAKGVYNEGIGEILPESLRYGKVAEPNAEQMISPVGQIMGKAEGNSLIGAKPGELAEELIPEVKVKAEKSVTDELLNDAFNGEESIASDTIKKTKLDYSPTSGAVLNATSGKTTTILGSYKRDTSVILDELGNIKSTDFGPRDGGFNLLNTPDELYLTPQQFWEEYNKPWLDNVIKRGDIIKIATEPIPDNLYRINLDTGLEELTGFGKEIKHLQEHGYVYDKILKEMKLIK